MPQMEMKMKVNNEEYKFVSISFLIFILELIMTLTIQNVIQDYLMRSDPEEKQLSNITKNGSNKSNGQFLKAAY